MIGDFEVKQAMNRLSNAYSRPHDPIGTLDEYKLVLKDKRLRAQPAELSEAVTEYIRTHETAYGFPSPASIRRLIVARREPQSYREPSATDIAPVEAIRAAWIAAGIDMEELKRLHDQRKPKHTEVRP